VLKVTERYAGKGLLDDDADSPWKFLSNASFSSEMIPMLLRHFQFYVTFTFCISCYGQEPRWFTVDLDSAPQDRWREVILAFQPEIETAFSFLKKMIPDTSISYFNKIKNQINLPFPYDEELNGISSLLYTPYEDVLAVNLFYEWMSYSLYWKENINDNTSISSISIVTENRNGRILHGHNLEFDYKEYLTKITITVDFKKKGVTMYTGTTFAGFVGLYAGQNPLKYTISINYREDMDLYHLYYPSLNGTESVISLFVRDLLARDDLCYAEVVELLSIQILVTPCYFVVAGISSGEGVVLSRSVKRTVHYEYLNSSNEKWYIQQMNADLWQLFPLVPSWVLPAVQMDLLTRAKISYGSFYKVLSKVLAVSDTVYTVVMSAANPEHYSTHIHLDSLIKRRRRRMFKFGYFIQILRNKMKQMKRNQSKRK